MLDADAVKRATSTYFPRKVLPMLPEVLSNGVCSLQPHELRFTKSVYLTYNKDATLRSTHVANTVIESKARLSYQQAARLLKGKPDPGAAKRDPQVHGRAGNPGYRYKEA